jgi:hypothetical protein
MLNVCASNIILVLTVFRRCDELVVLSVPLLINNTRVNVPLDM